MSDFADSWDLSRQRFLDEIRGLDDDQLRWKLHVKALSIGQMALHVAGVEISFASQLLGEPLNPRETRLKSAATDGVVNDLAFPYPDDSITAELVSSSLETSKLHLEPLMREPSEESLKRELKSALGPIISGRGALARLGFHSAYHQGQAYLMKTCPEFPA